MLTKLEITSNQGAVLELPLADYSEGYFLKEIEGLDPVKSTLVSSSAANQDGEQYHTARREARNLVLKMDLIPDSKNGTARDLRANLYKYLMPQTQAKYRFFDDDIVEGYVDIYGIVETLSCPPFQKEPEAAISIMCHAPNFYEPTPLMFEGTTVSTTEYQIDYRGTVETGFIFTLIATEDLPEGFSIYHRGPDFAESVMEYSEPLASGDFIYISTISGSKSASLTNDADGSQSVLENITQQSAWLNLFPGTNYIRVDVGEDPIAVPFAIEYTVKHGGL